MDKLSEFFKELKDRFSNPLFFSFVIGWLAINWKIVTGLFFYSQSQLNQDGYSSYFDLILKTSNWKTTFVFPLAIALVYTFLFPIIRNWIGMFNAWNQKWGTEKTLNISKDGKISVSKYIRLREVYDQRRLLIEDVLNKESGLLTENEKLRTQTMELQNKLNEQQEITQQYNSNNDSRYMNGDWILKIGSELESKRVIISNGAIYANDQYQRGPQLFQIHNIAFNTANHEFIMLYEELANPGKIFGEVFQTRSGYISHLKNKSNKGVIIELRKDDFPS